MTSGTDGMIAACVRAWNANASAHLVTHHIVAAVESHVKKNPPDSFSRRLY